VIVPARLRKSGVAARALRIREPEWVEEIEQIERSTDRKFLRIESIASKKRSQVWLLDDVGPTSRRSTTELNSDSHSQHYIVDDSGRNDYRTDRSCGVAPAAKTGPSELAFRSQFSRLLQRNAGPVPAFFLREPALDGSGARRAEFISVSVQCTDRSALRSDLRLKRNSGPVAATEPPRAPMNSPGLRYCKRTPGFHSSVLTL
jgi:hypothetical protein